MRLQPGRGTDRLTRTPPGRGAARDGGTTTMGKNDHLILTAEACRALGHPFRTGDDQCPVCDGGLACCVRCPEYEAGLGRPCRATAPDAPAGIVGYATRNGVLHLFRRADELREWIGGGD